MVLVHDVDGSVLVNIREVEVAKGVTARYFINENESVPHEVNLIIGGVDCDCTYSEELQSAIERVETLSAVEMFEVIGKYLV